MKHTELALRRPVATIMVFLALAAVGVIASRLLPLEKFPDIQYPGLFIQVPYPGSTPEEVERRITRPIEEALATMSGIERMESDSDKDQAEIRVFFGWGEKDASAKGIDARAKIDAIRQDLPADVERVFIFTGSLSDQPILNLRISSERDLSNAYDLLDRNLKRRMERLEGVSRVTLYGVDPREIRILLDADRVAAHNVDIAALQELLVKSNFSVSGGRVTEAGQRFSLRPQGEFQSIAEIGSIIVDGRNLRLRDIARIELRTPDRNYGRHLNRKYAIGLDVFKETTANMVDVADRVVAEVAEVAQTPQMRGINIFELENSANGVKDSLSNLLRSGLIGAVLAIGVLYVFLRQWSTTLIVTLAVPFSLLMTLAAMYFFGLSLNILSMMGLMLAVGMLVDNAVVVTESVFRQRQLHPGRPLESTLAGVREVGLAVLAGTATSVIVFLPIMFGAKVNITIFLEHVALTIVVALIASLVLAQTLVPMLAARVPPPPPPRRSSAMSWLTARYADALHWTLSHRWKTALGILLVLASVAVPMKLVKFDTFPQEASRRLYMEYHIEGQHSLDLVERAVSRVEDYLFAHQQEFEIRDVYSYFDPGRAQSAILLVPKEEAHKSTTEVITAIEAELPEIVIGKPSFKFDQTGGGEGFSLQVSGDSTEVLAGIARELVRVLSTVDGLTAVRSDVASGEEEVRVIVDRERAMQVGLSTEAIAGSVATAMRGSELRDFRGEDSEIDMRLTFRESDKETLEQLERLPLYTPLGERIALGSVADLEVTRGPRRIHRVGRATAALIRANLDGTSMDEVKPQVEKLMAGFALPPGYNWKFGRGFEETDRTQRIMLTNILLGVAMIFIVMAALFESTLLPMSIITSIVFSIVGVFWFFLLTGTTFSFMASIGIMILIGVVVNNGIVLVDHINNLRLQGVARYDAIIQAGRDRLRPILMTVATTILGLLPLSIGTTQVGGDGPPYFPMARAIIGGLAFSTVTSLVVVPTVYVWFDGLSRWMRKVVATAAGARASA